jgi:hypothetical protein
MKTLKKLRIALLGCMALVAFNTSAQTRNVPVSCSWVLVSSSSGSSGAIINLKCQESTGSIAATKVINYRTGMPQSCSISLSSGVFNSGTCQNESLYREKITVSPCKNSGTYIASGCANSMTSSAGFGAEVIRLCGAANCVTYQNLGGVNGCYRESPFLNAYCK